MLDGLNILTISGWTQPHDALRLIAPNAEAIDYVGCDSVEAVGALAGQTDYDMIMGWSLGGVLARELLNSGMLKAKAFVSLSSPYQFVADAHMPHAMGPTTFQQFYDNYRDDTERTTTRFHGLVVSGDSRQRDVMAALKHHEQVLATEKWLPWLDFLRIYSVAGKDYNLPSTLIIHGEQDAIVPHAQAPVLAKKMNARLVTMQDAAHAPHLHDADAVRGHITEFYQSVAHG